MKHSIRPLEHNLVTFSSDHFEENRYRPEDLVKLVPFGLSLTADPGRPTLILKDEKGEQVLPVAISPIEAGVALAQSNPKGLPTTPHTVARMLLESLHIKIEKCVFVEIKGAHQYVRLYFDGHPNMGSMKVRAEEAISLCLHLGVDIFATPQLMEKSRRLAADLEKLNQGVAMPSQLHPALLANTHEYIQ